MDKMLMAEFILKFFYARKKNSQGFSNPLIDAV